MSQLHTTLLLRKQLAEVQANSLNGFSVGLVDENNLFRWEVLIMGPPDTPYEGGLFKALVIFPEDYPSRPPCIMFTTEIWHPNIAQNGEVCVSILFATNVNNPDYGKPSEPWLYIHAVEAILLSVISVLADPSDEEPANVHAAKEFRDSYEQFKKRVAQCVRKSQEDCS